jgi:hypothetical protein
MAWRLTGDWYEVCSCKMFCPCNIGTPAEPDRGWCSAGIVLDIQQGSSDGVELGGTRAALALDFPGDFWLGNGTGRIYVDSAASPEQRRELEAILGGQRGGAWEAAKGVLTKVLPTQATKIDVQGGESPSARVGTVAELRWQRVKTPDGRQTRLENGAALAAFGIPASMDVARSDGSRWADPELRQWESGGTGGIVRFDWRA